MELWLRIVNLQNLPVIASNSFVELRNLQARVYALHEPAATASVHATHSPPTMNGPVSHVDSNQTPPLSPRSYTEQIPSPIFNTSTPNPTLSNARAGNYLQPYVNVPQSQSMIEMYTSSSAVYSPNSSPFYPLPNNLLAEHEVKIEGMPHSSPHGIHSHSHHTQPQQHHHHHHQQMMHHQNHSRSPSLDDEHELQSQIMSRNMERPSVVNIKME